MTTIDTQAHSTRPGKNDIFCNILSTSALPAAETQITDIARITSRLDTVLGLLLLYVAFKLLSSWCLSTCCNARRLGLLYERELEGEREREGEERREGGGQRKREREGVGGTARELSLIHI